VIEIDRERTIRVSALLKLEKMDLDARKITVNEQQKPGKTGT
jgi:hypothetical protein